jgi:hypothetical protein
LRKDWCKMFVKIFNRIHEKIERDRWKNKKRVPNVIRFLFNDGVNVQLHVALLFFVITF